LLSAQLLPEQLQGELTYMLIEQYLKVESPPRDKAAFLGAVKCLGTMQNDLTLAHLSELHQGRRSYTSWRIDGDATFVSATGRSGLSNLGATCFLNSTLQQFYAIIPLEVQWPTVPCPQTSFIADRIPTAPRCFWVK
jgi:hypothetical protein